MGSGGKGSSQIEVTEYFMTIHMGVCAYRKGMELLRFYVGDKEAWSGQKTRLEQFEVSEPELFGGRKKEGGVAGLVSWLPGAMNQILPLNIANRLSTVNSEVPGFRGMASLFFSGTGPSGGFLWCANNPYLKPVKVRVRGVPDGLNPAIAMIDLPEDSFGRPQKAANPAHIIYECFVNRSWGMGTNPSGIDIGSFEKAAQTLYDESFGLGMIWTRQTEIENFINEVKDHIQATIFMHPLTGKHTIRLLRADYDVDELDVLTPDNAMLMNFKRKMWGETSNEIVVSYTDPETENEKSVTVQDPGLIAMQGGEIVSTSKNYYGVRSEELALRLGQRDIAMMSSPIATCQVEVTRDQWNKVPGDVVKVTWPEHGISQIVFRVEDVNYGSADSSRIRLTLMEDIFALENSEYVSASSSLWINPNVPPAPLTRFNIQTIPAFLMSRELGLNSPADLVFPESLIAVAAGKNTFSDTTYELQTKGTGVSGDEIVISLGERPHSATDTLPHVLTQQATSTITLSPNYIGPAPRVDDFVLIGSGSEQSNEIALITSISGDDLTVWRGVLDTTPKNWSVGTRYWVLSDNIRFIDATTRTEGEVASYKMLNRTPRGLFSETLALWNEYTATDRPHLPNRPANVFVNGTGFGTHDATGQGVFNVSWARRNRTVEVLQVFAWWEGDMTPEVGQTTTVRLLQTNGSLITEFTDIEGTSQEVLLADFSGATQAIIEVVSVLDGAESLQGHRIQLSNIGS